MGKSPPEELTTRKLYRKVVGRAKGGLRALGFGLQDSLLGVRCRAVGFPYTASESRFPSTSLGAGSLRLRRFGMTWLNFVLWRGGAKGRVGAPARAIFHPSNGAARRALRARRGLFSCTP